MKDRLYKFVLGKLSPRLRDQRGQSAIEFIVIVIVVLFFLMFFLSLAILLVVSDYVEYATFMTARTYKSMFASQESQERFSRDVFNAYTQKINGIARNFRLEYVNGPPGDEQSSGVRASYDIDMFYLPPIFIPENIPPSVIRLQTESRLGREPSGNECQQFFLNFSQRFGLGIEGTKILSGMDDNGC